MLSYLDESPPPRMILQRSDIEVISSMYVLCQFFRRFMPGTLTRVSRLEYAQEMVEEPLIAGRWRGSGSPEPRARGRSRF